MGADIVICILLSVFIGGWYYLEGVKLKTQAASARGISQKALNLATATAQKHEALELEFRAEQKLVTQAAQALADLKKRQSQEDFKRLG